jgi:hypothetical protein
MAPELMEGEPATTASDLYSCGVMLSECLSDDDSHPAVRRLAELLSREDPADRPASAEAAMAELLRPRPTLEPQTALTQPDAVATEPPPEASSPPPPPRRAPARHGRTIHVDRPRLIAIAALAVVAVLAVILIAVSGGGEEAPTGERLGAGNAAGQGSGTGEGESGSQGSGGGSDPGEGSASSGYGVPEPDSSPDPARGAQLNEEGKSLLDAGQPEESVPVLEDAVAAFPRGTDDINYAFALYNLGDALLQSGRPEDAIPILERRLEIPNQTDTVQQTLDAARAEAD